MARPPTEVHEMEESHREVVERVPAAECTKPEIPAVQERREKGKPEISGTVSDGNGIRAEKVVTPDTYLVWMDSNINGGDYPILNLKGGDGLDSSNEVSLPVLGKRNTMQKEVDEGWDSDEAVQKREKVDKQITQKN
nr:hypothetical protein CFP56_51680 [Quercus suber]